MQNDRDWLRQAQRIPVTVEFDADEDPRRLESRASAARPRSSSMRGDNPLMNLLGAIYIRVASWLTYLY